MIMPVAEVEDNVAVSCVCLLASQDPRWPCFQQLHHILASAPPGLHHLQISRIIRQTEGETEADGPTELVDVAGALEFGADRPIAHSLLIEPPSALGPLWACSVARLATNPQQSWGLVASDTSRVMRSSASRVSSTVAARRPPAGSWARKRLAVTSKLRRLWAEASEASQDSRSCSSLSARVALPRVVIWTAGSLVVSRAISPPKMGPNNSLSLYNREIPGLSERAGRVRCVRSGPATAMNTLLLLLDLLGTFVFALSGAIAGVKRRLDLFGVLVLSFVAGNFGGIICGGG